jgi:hypothetical protein
MKLHKEVFEGMMSTAFNGSIEWGLTELAAMRCLKIILEEAEDYDDLPPRFKEVIPENLMGFLVGDSSDDMESTDEDWKKLRDEIDNEYD